MTKLRRGFVAACIGALALSGTAAVGPAAGNEADIERGGACTGSARWELKLSPENGRIEVEFEVDQNVNGETWKVVLKKDGGRFFRDRRTTKAPSGSFQVRKVTGDGAGAERIVAKATHVDTSQVCRGAATFD